MTEPFSYVWLIPLLPLLGAFINIFCNRNPRVSGMIACAMVAVSFLLVLGVFFQLIGMPEGDRSVDVVVYSWITAGTFSVDVAFLIDPLSTVMMLVVTGVGLLIHVYSIGYMGKDTCCVRYFSYLNLFMFAMLILVMGNNFLLLFVGWEGVGLCSYLLIGFWCERQSAANAGMKAFVVNRVGDFAFIIGLLLVFLYAGSLTYADVFATDPAVLAPVITAITLLLFIGAMGKSAQVPLHVWLPDAMEGPTPVSALIHAATMVTAGVYMVARCHALFAQSVTAMTVVAVIGAVTALFAAYIALTQCDIKRVLAYSTISQLGYMFLACGVGYFTAGIFHLVTHAFFKALLFMGAGSVIHALEHALEKGRDPQDLRNMGGLSSLMPVTYKSMLLATLAIAGIAPFAGFFSKDLILLGAFVNAPVLWVVGLVTAVMTAFYMFRLLFMTFGGKTRLNAQETERVHESSRVMTIPLVILAILSTAGGFIGIPHVFAAGMDRFGGFLAPVFSGLPEAPVPSSSVELALMVLTLLLAAAGIWGAYAVYIRGNTVFDRLVPRALYTLSLRKFYVDETYDTLIVGPLRKIAWGFWRIVDNVVIDGGLTLAALTVRGLGNVIRYTQTGVVQNYALIMVIGALAVFAYITGYLGP